MASTSVVSRLKSPWVLLLLAVGLAAVVAYIAYAYLQQREVRIRQDLAASNSKKQTPKASVVVPREDSRVGTVVDLGIFVTREIEQDLVYPDTILANDFPSVRGQTLARPVLRGRPLRLTDLTAPEIRDVASLLPAGTRAVTIEIDNVNSIAQTLRPGHRVDVFLLSAAPRKKGAEAEATEASMNQATLYMQNLAVLATGQQFQDISDANADRLTKMARPGEVEGQREKGFDTVTVLVTPGAAARLLVGQKLGSYRVALRGGKDDRTVAMGPLTSEDVMPTPRGGGGAGGDVEFIVGGKSGGSAALPSTLVAMGLKSADGARVATPAATTRPADVRGTVEEVMRSMMTPRTIINADSRETKSATNPSSK